MHRHRAGDADPHHRHLHALHEDLPGEALMNQSRATIILRDIVAILVVAAFMFPLFWWG